MNKTNYIILTFVLCFSISFVAYPLKGFSSDLENGAGYYEQPSEDYIVPDYANHIVELPPSEDNGNGNGNGDGNGTTDTTKEKERKKYKYKVCATGAGCAEAGTCVNTSTYNKNKADECQTDADCNGGTPPPVSPPSNGGTPSSNGGYTPPVWTPPAGPPPTLPDIEPCMINYLELPERAWVGYPITGKWSASDWCDDCDIDCTPYPECVWKQDSIGIGFDEYKFTIEQSGTFNYTLTCYGEGGIDERTKSATVKALNLPWWREIIPVLRGFLRGVWG